MFQIWFSILMDIEHHIQLEFVCVWYKKTSGTKCNFPLFILFKDLDSLIIRDMMCNSGFL